jgi:hypothetical protein
LSGEDVPVHTILIVGGSWVILLALTIWNYRRRDGGNGE